MIPITALRHFYHRLRDFPSEKFHRAALHEVLRRHDRLQKLTQDSYDHFSLYDNVAETFRPDPGSLTLARRRNSDQANRLLSLIAMDRCSFVGVTQLQFVDADISPVRTTRSEYENGRPATSSPLGGLDVLMANADDRLPVVGEIKADTDRNPFLGFIQSLTYAVELSTPAQRRRLDQSYPGRFAWPASGPWIDICLLLVRYPEDPRKREFITLTRQLVEKIVAPETPIGNIVRRVSCLGTEFNQPDKVQFEVKFVHPAVNS
jgi:hypothetical protein